MDELNLIVMGKTGAGKSTLINAVLKEDLAPTGSGQAVTRENQVYTKRMLLPLYKSASTQGDYRMVARTLNMYDTVGLEIDSSITQETLREIKKFIEKAQKNEKANDLTMVWFCVNYRCNRFEPYEIDLIRSLSIEQEIPFILVLTQSYTDEKSDLEKQLRENFPEITVLRVLAQDYKLRNASIKAYGITELLQRSILDYDKSKVHLLESKLVMLAEDRKNRISQMRASGIDSVASYADKAMKIGFVPGGCIPIVHGLCIAMLRELNKKVGITSSDGFATEIFTNAVVGLVATPIMVVPFLSAVAARAYVEEVGESYLYSLMAVIERSTDEELKNNDLMADRIKREIQNRRKK